MSESKIERAVSIIVSRAIEVAQNSRSKIIELIEQCIRDLLTKAVAGNYARHQAAVQIIVRLEERLALIR